MQMNKNQILAFGFVLCFIMLIIFVGISFHNDDNSPTNIIQKSETEITSTTFPADLNTITKDQLMEIDGIGDAYAQRIIDYRSKIGEFDNVEQLLNVTGIGEKTLEKLKDYLYVTNPTYETAATTISKYETTTITTIISNTTPKTTTSVTSKSSKVTTTKSPKTTTTKPITTTTSLPERKPVNLNTATFEELKNNLLLTDEQAQAIIELRELITYFSNPLEVLLANKPNTNKQMFTENEYNQIKDYLYV